jgi:hypothetical protein
LSSHLLSKNIKIKIHKTILPALLYEYETWSHTLREEHRLRVFENRVLREYLDLRGRKGQEAEEDCIMRSFITYTLHQALLG